TYPGFGCGVVLRPQFPESELYAQAQSIAFYKSQHAPQVTGPLVRTAEAEATRTIRDNFIQPTVNALGYSLDRLTRRSAAPPAGPWRRRSPGARPRSGPRRSARSPPGRPSAACPRAAGRPGRRPARRPMLARRPAGLAGRRGPAGGTRGTPECRTRPRAA